MSETEERQVAAAVERYILAMSTSDEPKLRAVFHPSAAIMGNYQGAVEWLSIDAYIGEVLGAGLPANHNPDWTILSLDITDNAAAVKIAETFGSMTFTDYLSLLKIAGTWTIVSKLYHLHT